ncbi:MAG: hypothetical protein JOZ17_11855 [Acetobacteraceae bacterium]|nr:hypothetical protein [Acetobacteraceae bacterium]
MTRTIAPQSRGNNSPPEKIPVPLTINGNETELRIAPWTTLLDALRASIG